MPELKVEAIYVGQDLDRGLKGLQKELAQTADQAGRLGGSLGTSIPKGANAANTALNNLGKNAGQSIFNLTEKLKQLQSSVFTEKDRGKIAAYNKEIKNTEKQIASLSSVGTSGFGALGAGAGKAFSVLRNIAYILPGVGIAGLLSFAVEPIAAFVSKLFEASDAVKKLAEQEKKREDFNNEVAKNFGKEVTQLQVLRAVIENSNIPLEKRLQAIKDLKKEYPGYFDNLNTDGLLNGQLAQYYDLATQAILRKARASAATSALEEIANKKISILLKDQAENTKRLKALSEAGAGIQNKNVIGGGAFISLAETKKNINDQYTLKRNAAQKEIDALNTEQAFYLKIAASGAAEFNKIDADKIKRVERTSKTISDILAELAKEIDFLNRKELAFNTNESKAKVSAYFSTIDKLIKDFKPTKNLIDSLFSDAGDIKIKNFLKTVKTEFDTGIIAAPLEIPIDFAPKLPGESLFPKEVAEKLLLPSDAQFRELSALGYLKSIGVTKGMQDGLKVGVDGLRFPELTSLADKMESELANLASNINAAIVSTFANVGSGIAEAIGAVIAGETVGLGGIFQAFISALAEGITAIGKALVQYGIAKTIVENLKISGPAAIALGFGLQIFGAALKSSLKLQAFATGGASAGGSILVGERGPEIISPPRGSVITPNAQTNAILGGGGGVYIPSVTLRGQDLVIAFKRASDANGRNGQ